MLNRYIKAHFDGEHIHLDEPLDLPTNVQFYISIVSEELLKEREEWLRLSEECLAQAYGDDEPEYTLDDVID